MVLDVTHPAISYKKEKKTFSAEISNIETARFSITDLCHRGAPIWIRNPKTGVQVKMTRSKVDTDGEDTYGWWYQGTHEGNPIKFLFIND